MGISRSTSRARGAKRMSRAISPALARLTSARASPVSKWTTLSRSRLLYGSPQRRTGMCSMGKGSALNAWLLNPARRPGSRAVWQGGEHFSIYPDRRRGRELAEGADAADAVPGELLVGRL